MLALVNVYNIYLHCLLRLNIVICTKLVCFEVETSIFWMAPADVCAEVDSEGHKKKKTYLGCVGNNLVARTTKE